jgi:hypothetical protein
MGQSYDGMVHESIIHIKDKQGTITKSLTLQVDVNLLKAKMFPQEFMEKETEKILQKETEVIFQEGNEHKYNFKFNNDNTFKIGVVSMLVSISKGEKPIIPMIVSDYIIEDHGFIKTV